MPPRLTAALTLLALAGSPSAATLDQVPQRFLAGAFHLSAADLAQLGNGDVISKTLDSMDRREVATFGVVRIDASPEKYVERLTDIAEFKRTDGILQVGAFSTIPRLEDVAALTIEEADLTRLRECHVGDCEVRLSVEGIERLQRDIDWRSPHASRTAGQAVRQVLVDYVARYGQLGAAASMEYADRVPRLNVGREFASLIEADPIIAKHAPRLRRHLLDYPASTTDTRDFVYWSKELVRSRPVISVTHVAITAGSGESPIAYAIGSKQIYAMHYYDASLGLTLLVPDRTAESPAMYVVYLNRSRVDVFERLFGGVARRIVAGRARSLVAAQLKRLQGTFKT